MTTLTTITRIMPRGGCGRTITREPGFERLSQERRAVARYPGHWRTRLATNQAAGSRTRGAFVLGYCDTRMGRHAATRRLRQFAQVVGILITRGPAHAAGRPALPD
jgi:hypothetical protein